MGLTKTELFTEKQTEIAKLTKAIGHPARVAIINYLLKQNTCICKNIVDELPLSQPTVSQHLKELKTAGLIKGSIQGKAVCYCLDKQGFEQLQAYCSKVLDQINCQNQNC